MNHDASHRYEWNTIPWRKLEVRVFKLQKRIYQATTRGEVQKAHRLQKLLASSWSAKSLAVRRVTQENTGKKTAGVDGMKNLTPPKRLNLISDMDLHTPVKPVRRVWIDKPGKPEKRPLGIPIMHDRATQALVKLAAEPEWEAKFEPNSFGFRPGRSCQDAIQQIFLTIQRRPRYVLDADIASCFDKIDQAALLEKMHTSPHFARPIKEWLKAGVVDSGIFMPTDQGTPQGGVLSPLLANIALHGLEDAVQKTRGPATIVRGGKRVTNNVHCIRYADDFVVFHNTWEGIQRCKEAIQEWLQGMGLALKDAKTRFAHTLEAKEECGGNVGFDFLGFTVRQFPVGKDQTKTHASYKTIIKPSKSSIHRHTHIERHTPLHRGASPYDGNWSYWGTRRGKYIGLDTVRGKLLKHQGGRCTHCQLFFTVDDKLEIHHADGNHKNRKFDNLRLLHLICHDLVHGKGGKQCTT